MEFTVKGDYNSSTTYYQYDVVKYSNKEYVCINDVSGTGITGVSPLYSSYWSFFDPVVEVVYSKERQYIDEKNYNFTVYNIFEDVYKYENIKIPKIDKKEMPKDGDYKKGYMYRYFYKQSNNLNAVVREINKAEYNKIKSYYLYDVIKIKWKLIGNRQKASEVNKNVIYLANARLNGVKHVLLRDTLQYWKDLPDIVPDKINVTDTYRNRALLEKDKLRSQVVTNGTLVDYDGLPKTTDRYILDPYEDDIILTQGYVAIVLEEDNRG